MFKSESPIPNVVEAQEAAGRRAPLANFLGIGVQKAGTTWLHHMLGAHPEVFVAKGDDKDLRFFSSFYDFGFSWYEAYFAEAGHANRRGEISTSYFYSKDAPERVFRYNPEMRLILSLRSPADRLISHHKHEIRIGHLTGDLSLDRGIDNNPSYVEQSMYFTQLIRWLEYFPLSRFHIMIFEEVFRDPASAVRDMYQFLEVDPEFVPHELNLKVNASRIPRSWLLDQGVSLAASNFRRLGLGWFVDRLKDAGLNSLITKSNTQPDNAMEISDADYQRLRGMFAIENAKLSRLLAIDLSAWDD
jgi:hypothetical protein